jgi:hypothetical protein
MTNQRETPTLQNALYELTRDNEIPTPEALERSSRQYPQFAEALTEFAISLVLGVADDDRRHVETDAERNLVSKAMSNFQNGLYDLMHGPLEAASPSGVPNANEVEDLFAKMDKKGFRALVTRLDATSVFVMKIRDRQIRPETMSKGCLGWIAREIGTVPEHLVAHLSMPAQVQAGVRWKSDVKPTAPGKQSFEEAVRSSGLSEEQQRRLFSH